MGGQTLTSRIITAEGEGVEEGEEGEADVEVKVAAEVEVAEVEEVGEAVDRDLEEETEGTMKLKKWEYSRITRFLSRWKGAAMGSWTLFTIVF
jgi:hypothetical protein